jgi:hypothetical protein
MKFQPVIISDRNNGELFLPILTWVVEYIVGVICLNGLAIGNALLLPVDCG